MIQNDLLNYFDHSLNAVFVVQNGKIEYCNPSAKRLFSGIQVNDDASRLNHGVITGDVPSTISTVICGKACSISVMPYGEFTVYTVYLSPERSESRNTDMIAPVCSALRDALSTMKISGDLLAPYIDNGRYEQAGKYAAVIAHSYHKMARIVGNLSQIENMHSESKLNKENFDLSEFCRNLCDTISAVMSDKKIDLTYNGPEHGIIYNGSTVEIERMLLNLISNSYKYTPAGGEISVTLKNSKQSMLVSVTDSGCGMSDSALAGAFRGCDPERTLTDVQRGIGFGLNIVRHIAEKHGGSVFIESREGEGTCVTVSLPINNDNTGMLHTVVTRYESGGIGVILTELADVLSYKAYMPEFMD